MRRILVTGASGFLGRHLLELLSREARGWQLFRTARKPVPGPGRIFRCDLTEPGAVRRLIERVRPRITFHMVGTPSLTDPRELHRTFFLTTVLLLESLSRARTPGWRLVLPGSAAEYGEIPRRFLPARENAPTVPVSLYGQAKLIQTRTALSYLEKGAHVLVARIFNLLGPGTPEHLAVGCWVKQLARISQGRIPPLLKVRNLNTERDFLDARDAARALWLLSRRGRAGQIYNVCSGRAVRMRSMLTGLLRAALGRRPLRIESGYWKEKGSAKDVQRVLGSFGKINAETGWAPAISMAESLRATWQSYTDA